MFLCGDWLHEQGAKIKFNPSVLTVNFVKVPLENTLDVSVAVDEEIKLPPMAAVLGKVRIVTIEGIGEILFQLTQAK